MRKKLMVLTAALALAAGASLSAPRLEAANGCRKVCCPDLPTRCCTFCPGHPPCEMNCP
ncbi:MAG TPA: hypothetical protein VF173_07385 [Thermoanaerobaculia bacterium]|nr:hypothetical protein [Thermoanaerobaculia bacterium]